MKDDLLKLAEYLEGLAKEVPAIASGTSKLYTHELMKGLIRFSPVDTSQLLSNWIITVNSKSETIRDPHYKGKSGSTRELSGYKTLIDATLVLQTVKPGDTIYISNLAPQVVYTNYGTTKQEPQYFIERAMQLAEKAITTKNVEIKLDAKL